MKTSNIILVVIIIMIVGLIVWRNSRNNVTSLQIKTEQPFITTIEYKIVIPGNLFPLTEIEIKSPISGTLERYYIEIGDNVKVLLSSGTSIIRLFELVIYGL